jgi:phage tail tape-measure protein
MTTNTTPSFPASRRDPRQVPNTLKRTLNYNDPDIALASFANALPQGAVILQTIVEIITPFNAGSTNPVTVGTNSTTYNNIATTGDINAAAAGVDLPTRGLGQSIAAAADTPVYATYVPTGTAPTAGKAQITIVFEGGWAS